MICPTEQARDSFRAEGVPEPKLITVPNGVDLDRFRPAADRTPHPFRALFVGQIGFRKGVPYLLQAWQRLGWRDAELWLAGKVPNQPIREDTTTLKLELGSATFQDAAAVWNELKKTSA